MATYLLIGLGSALGGMARYWSSGLVAVHFGETFPWGSLTVNVIGSFAIGFVATLTAPDGRLFVSSDLRQFFMLGVCGGFTTFSSVSLQTLSLMREGEWLKAAANISASMAFCLFAVWLGHMLAAALNQLR